MALSPCPAPFMPPPPPPGLVGRTPGLCGTTACPWASSTTTPAHDPETRAKGTVSGVLAAACVWGGGGGGQPQGCP